MPDEFESGPDVIVDFVFDEGLIYIVVENIGDKPACKVSVAFDRRLVGADGKVVSDLPLFKNIEFLAPWKQISVFFDSSSSFFRREDAGRPVSVQVSFRDRQGNRRGATITHNLEIYREIGYVSRNRGGHSPQTCGCH